MNSLLRFILRYLSVLFITCVLSCCGVLGNAGATQALFTVLGISFSITMSIIISFDLSNILNDSYRVAIRSAIRKTRNCIITDFIFATLILFLSSLPVIAQWQISTANHIVFNFQTFAICAIAMSIIYEVCNFIKIHDLHDDIADKVIAEKKK